MVADISANRNGVGGYQALTTMVVGTVFTDPYGVEYTSPTPVWIYDDVTYRTSEPTPTGTGYACPEYSIGFGTDGYMTPYPHGKYLTCPDLYQNRTKFNTYKVTIQ
jgi:hypothetical protein